MGRNFDERLPFMSDEELASVQEWPLDKISKDALAAERRGRGVAANIKHRLWKFIGAVVGLVGGVATLIALLI